MHRIEIVRDDITTLAVDAIVNAANNRLSDGAGVNGAIHRAAGPRLPEACRAIGGCETGAACITEGFDLPARWIIHTVGPVWNGGEDGEPDLLASCYRASLRLARNHDARSIAFPAISCGVFGYPVAKAMTLAVGTVAEFLREDRSLERVLFCCFEDAVHDVTRAALAALKPAG